MKRTKRIVISQDEVLARSAVLDNVEKKKKKSFLVAKKLRK